MENVDEVRVERDGTPLATFYVAVMLWLNFKKGDHKVHNILCSNFHTQTLLMGPRLEKNNAALIVSWP